MDNLGFSCCDINHRVFFRVNKKGLIIILVHMDDCTLVSLELKLVNWVKEKINEYVEVTDLREIHWLLGVEVKRSQDESKLILSQHSYINASLQHFGFEDAKPSSIPMDPSIHLSTNQSPKSTAMIACMS
jgi:hypothetical protein